MCRITALEGIPKREPSIQGLIYASQLRWNVLMTTTSPIFLATIFHISLSKPLPPPALARATFVKVKIKQATDATAYVQYLNPSGKVRFCRPSNFLKIYVFSLYTCTLCILHVYEMYIVNVQYTNITIFQLKTPCLFLFAYARFVTICDVVEKQC